MTRGAAFVAALLALSPGARAGDVSDIDLWTITEVYDGDTFMMHVPQLPPPLDRVSIRVLGVDAPELGARAHCAAERDRAIVAREFTRAFLARGPLQIDRLSWDKYGGRIDARVRVAGKDLAAELIAAGLGHPYNGGKRKGWCD